MSIYKLQTENDYITVKKNNLPMPNICSIVETKNIHINPKFVSKYTAEAGDIVVFHEHSNGEKEIKYMKPEAYDTNDTYWIPDAIVVVPYSHTDDGTIRAMGLYLADEKTNVVDTSMPQSFNFSPNEYIYRFQQNLGHLIKFSSYNAQDINSTFGVDQEAYLASDVFTTYNNPYDIYTGYHKNDTVAPSPYDAEGKKNEAYHSIGNFAIVNDNLFKDMDGKNNTFKILSELDERFLSQTLFANIVDNIDTEKIVTYNNQEITTPLFPAATICARYSSILKPCVFDTTKNLSENIVNMPWYLPSVGEMGYFFARRKQLKFSFEKINDNYKSENLIYYFNNNDIQSFYTSTLAKIPGYYYYEPFETFCYTGEAAWVGPVNGLGVCPFVKF